MRSRFEHCDQSGLFAPGASPFHIKGEFYRQMGTALQHHDQKSGGALMKVLEREGLRDFATQSFLSSAYYDVLPSPRLAMALAEARERDVYEMTSELGLLAVQGQMKGVYGRFLQQLSSATFCQRFDQVIRQFYDFGPITVTPAPGGAALLRTGMPLCIGEWWSLVTVPFVTVPLTENGATGVEVDWRLEPGGLVAGLPVCDVVWDVRWNARA